MFTNAGELPAHAQRVIGSGADGALGMRAFLGAGSTTFPPIFRVCVVFIVAIEDSEHVQSLPNLGKCSQLGTYLKSHR